MKTSPDCEEMEKHAADRMALDNLFTQVGIYRKSKDFKELLQFVRKFPKIAPFNALLLHIQKPGCTFVATEDKWRKYYHRKIKLGSRPLIILRNFGPVDYVFDISDTYGETVPEEVINPFKIKNEISIHKYDNLVNNLDNYGIKFIESDFGSQYAGCIKQIKAFKDTLYRGKNEYDIEFNYCIEVNKHHNYTEQFATIVHELGHLFCGHLGAPNEKLWPARNGIDKNSREFEAESTSWLVCERVGIKNPSAEYLSGYLNKNKTIPPISIETVLKSANKIEQMLIRLLQPSKYLVLNKKDN